MAVVCSLGLYTGGNHNRIRCDHMETPPAQVILSSRRSKSFRRGKFLLTTPIYTPSAASSAAPIRSPNRRRQGRCRESEDQAAYFSRSW